jgi:glycosyltransferase involved in cell wall biosynthesis
MGRVPRISLVMPTYNQASRLEFTLASLRWQAAPDESWELIVVDDGSTDDTSAVLDGFTGLLPLTVIRQRHAGRAAARNTGAAAASGAILVFCDGDRVCARWFLAAHMGALHKSALHTDPANPDGAGPIVLGEVREVYIGDLVGRREGLFADIAAGCDWLARRSRRPQFVAELHRQVFAPDGTAEQTLAWLCFLSGNVSLPRTLFEQAGGFDEDFVEWGFEHFELGYRLIGLGAVVRYQPDAVSYHLAHRREPAFYESGIAASATLMRRKRSGIPVDALVDLAKGEISLAEFRAALALQEVP